MFFPQRLLAAAEILCEFGTEVPLPGSSKWLTGLTH
jgi:hypothetical protein